MNVRDAGFPSSSEAAATPAAARRGRLFNALSGVIGTVAGLTPHLLHHVGPIAGAAVLTGTEGSFLFGTVGFLLTVPMLIRLKKRFATWAAPAIATGLFVAAFAVSTVWIGPAIRGDEGDAGGRADPHHDSSGVLDSPVFDDSANLQSRGLASDQK